MSGDAKNGQFLYDENTLQMMQKSGEFEITYCVILAILIDLKN